MKVLIDTQVWLWALGAPDRISARARSLLMDERNELWLSAATPWELAIKVAIGKLSLPTSVEDYVGSRSADLDLRHLSITFLHGIESARLPLHHRDPFDRVLVAQARLEGMTLLTADKVFREYDVAIAPASARMR